jgi:hypothetical protein
MSDRSGEHHVDDSARVVIRYESGRAARQLVGFGVAALIMIALAALGIVMIVASLRQMELAGKVIGCGFGIFFVLVALVSLVSSAEVLTRIVRWSRQSEPLVSIDDEGVDGLFVVDGAVGAGQPHLTWSEISSMRLDSHLPRARRTNALAQLDAEHLARQAVRRGLDRSAGVKLGMRDGRRSIGLELLDGRTAHRDLTLPLGPESFGAVVPRVFDLASTHGLDVELHGTSSPESRRGVRTPEQSGRGGGRPRDPGTPGCPGS